MLSNEELFAKLDGHPEAVNEVTVELLGFGIYLISKFRNHRLYNEIFSQMQITLMTALRRVSKGSLGNKTEKNVLAYVGKTVDMAVKDILIADSPIKVSRVTLIKSSKKNGTRRTVRTTSQEFLDRHSGDSYSAIDLQDMLRCCNLSDLEDRIVKLKLAGYTDVEIARLRLTTLNNPTGVRNARIRVCQKLISNGMESHR